MLSHPNLSNQKSIITNYIFFTSLFRSVLSTLSANEGERDYESVVYMRESEMGGQISSYESFFRRAISCVRVFVC